MLLSFARADCQPEGMCVKPPFVFCFHGLEKSSSPLLKITVPFRLSYAMRLVVPLQQTGVCTSNIAQEKHTACVGL